jgi:hypothetical protein
MKNSDPLGSLFSCHRRLPLPHRCDPFRRWPRRGGVASSAARPARVPGPLMPIEAIHKYKQRRRRHKRAVRGSSPIRVIPARFPATGRDYGLPGALLRLCDHLAGLGQPTARHRDRRRWVAGFARVSCFDVAKTPKSADNHGQKPSCPCPEAAKNSWLYHQTPVRLPGVCSAGRFTRASSPFPVPDARGYRDKTAGRSR